MELGNFDPFNPPRGDETVVIKGVFLPAETTPESDGCYPDPSRSAVQIPTECERIHRNIRRIRPTDNPFEIE